MKKIKKHKKTPKYIEKRYWNTFIVVNDELIDRINIWHFNYFVASTIIPLLEDFLDVADLNTEQKLFPFFQNNLKKSLNTVDFITMISSINLLVRYFNEGGLIYDGININFEAGDTIVKLSEALHLFVDILPYLNDRHFCMSIEKYYNTSNGRHCDFNELCHLDKTIAKRIFPTLQVFATLSIFPPINFNSMYAYKIQNTASTEKYNSLDEWHKALDMMVEAWRWILERKPSIITDGQEDVPEKVRYGLHLFAEYLPEMQND